MQVRELGIAGAWEFTPKQHADDRGVFMESFTRASFQDAVGFAFDLKQMNVSVSSAGTVRGIHFADVPPSQAKYVQCMSGSILDVVIDIRVGSPTFGQWDASVLDDVDRRCLYISEGLGHAFCALEDGTTVTYACSEPYAPSREHGVHPLDTRIGIAWPSDLELVLSPKDAAAPSLDEAVAAKLLPRYEDCIALYASLRGE